jgi:hypothetical protein
MNLFLLIVLSTLTAGGPSQAPPPSAPAAAESSDDGAGPPPEEGEADLPVSIERVQRALSRPPAIKLNADRPVFRVEVLGKKLTIEDILGPDYLKGPVPRAGMTHQEFLDMVTPKDYQGYAPYTNREAMTIAATSLALKWALQKAIHKYQTASQERDREAAQKEVEEALAELDKARLKAGLPPH